MNDEREETIADIVLSCLTLAGRTEDDFWADYERKCARKRILPLYGQVKTSLVALHRAGRIGVKTVGGRKLCFRK